jgi:Coenzyme F420-dependent N5,N10-methylene tetrahydromethanopterin reductase and related flavin-dependent oxidoreductases
VNTDPSRGPTTRPSSVLRSGSDPRFGLFLSQANKPLSQVNDEFQMAEDLGFDHAWLVDHLIDTDGPPSHPILEAWTLLAALAARTSRIRLGVLVTSNTFRHPAVLLKAAVTVDHISGGRLILGIGTGWHEPEYEAFGYPTDHKVGRFEEALTVITGLIREGRADLDGRWVQVRDAVLRPPARPDIPILIAAKRPRMLELTARHADA